jgi:hypothetical protein
MGRAWRSSLSIILQVQHIHVGLKPIPDLTQHLEILRTITHSDDAFEIHCICRHFALKYRQHFPTKTTSMDEQEVLM